jgi:cytosine/adenosine deaminase-related metal-dependent hydrolase
MADILIQHGTVITMDPERQVIEDGAVAVEKSRIVAVGKTDHVAREHQAGKVIDARRMAVMPGLVDGHAHAAHALVKTMGDGDTTTWYDTVRLFYTKGATVDFWNVEGRLAAVERLKNGVTTGVSYLGGGDGISRVDDPVYGIERLKAVKEVGIREFMALGPCRPPYPTLFSNWSGGPRRDAMISFEQQLEVTEEVIRRGHKKISDRLQVCVTFPVYGHQVEHIEILSDLKAWTESVRDLYLRYNVLLTQDGHRGGTVKFQHEQFGFSGPDAFFSHSVDLTTEEIELCSQMGTRIVHNPSAIASIRGRCPVPELIDAGVIVMLGSDAAAPDRGYDMFRHIFHAMHYHRTHFHDELVLPPGKLLEMATIDAAHGLGMEEEIGSLEVGKKADVILVDLFKPHLYPLNMIPSRIAYFAHGSDVDTVLVDGEILMAGREVLSVSEEDVLHAAQEEADAILDRTGTRARLELAERYWKNTHY